MSTERHRKRSGRLRALAALLALYGLVLQAFLTGLSPVPAAAAAGLICATHRPGEEAPAPHAAHPCCTVCCPALPLLPAPAAEAAWPARPVLRVLWQRHPALSARGPPQRAATARGPPFA